MVMVMVRKGNGGGLTISYMRMTMNQQLG